MLTVVERSFAAPRDNLAFDEQLLEEGWQGLRIWESPVHCVVVSRTPCAEPQVNIAACEQAGIEIIQRSSGGGAVLLGPGCLNYSLLLSLDEHPALIDVGHSYPLLLGSVAAALDIPGLTVEESDIAWNGRKVSGNAQRRTRGRLLHHGTLLYGLDIDLVEALLPEPTRRPAYRGARTHRDFLGALPLSPGEIKSRLARLNLQTCYVGI